MSKRASSCLLINAACMAMGLSSACLAADDEIQAHGQIRALQTHSLRNSQSMLNELELVLAKPAGKDESGNTSLQLEHELNLQGKQWYATLNTRLNRNTRNEWDEHTQLHQAYWNIESGAWQIYLGRKFTSWDVGYAYRPNDMVQQEARRNLYASTQTGKDQLSAEWFSATQALSLVAWRSKHSTPEASAMAYALRYYQRLPQADWYGFARYSADQGLSLGSAISWVADEAMELHASLRLNQRNRLSRDSSQQLINLSSPWQVQERRLASQLLLGATYTTEVQQSWLFEYWYDSLALNQDEWQFWQQRQTNLRQALKQQTISSAILLPQFAWQTQAYNQAENLRQHNLFVRWSQQYEAWQCSADLLWHPEDRGRILTLTGSWQGDKTRLELGVRRYGGQQTAVLRQLSEETKAFVNLSWAY